MDDGLLARAIDELTSEATSVVEDALAGKRGLGGYEPLVLLCRALALQPPIRGRGLELVVTAAHNPRVPADIRYDAIRGLSRIAFHIGLPLDITSKLDSIEEVGAAALLDFVTPRLLHAAKVALLVISGRDDLDSELLTLAHDEQPRVRRVAFEASGLALQSRTSEALEGALLSLSSILMSRLFAMELPL